MVKSTVFVFGNPLLKEDSLPIRLLPSLRKALPDVDFREIDPTEDLRDLGKTPIIIDTVLGPENIVMIKDLEQLEDSPNCSLHDMDLGMSLKLMKKTGMLDSVTIIGIPVRMKSKTAVEGIKTCLEGLIQ